MNGKLTSHFYQVADSLVKVSELRNFCLLKDGFLQVVQLSTETEILVCKPLGSCFDSFASFGNLSINSLVVVIESLKPITEHLGHIWGLAKNLSSEGLNLLHLSWSTCLLLHWEIISEFVLILLSEEVNQEFTASKHLWFHDANHELLIVNLLFEKLVATQLFLLIDYW